MADSGRTVFGVPGGSGSDFGVGPSVPWWRGEFLSNLGEEFPLNVPTSTWRADTTNINGTDGYGDIVTVLTVDEGEGQANSLQFTSNGIFQITSFWNFSLSAAVAVPCGLIPAITVPDHGQYDATHPISDLHGTGYHSEYINMPVTIPALAGDHVQFRCYVDTAGDRSPSPSNDLVLRVNIIQIG